MSRNIFYLEDSNGNIFYLNDASTSAIMKGTLSPSTDTFTFDSKIVERTGEPGSVKLGNTRLQARELSIEFVRSEADQDNFDEYTNNLLYFVQKTKYLVNETTGYRIEVSPASHTIEYEEGSYKHYSSETITFTALTPFWEETMLNTQIIAVTGGDPVSTVIDIETFIDTPLELSIVASAVCSSLEIYLQENLQGIFVSDPLLGQEGYETLVISNTDGTVKLGTLDRSQYIEAGTGFFKTMPGVNTLVILASGSCEVTVSYRGRRYI